MYRRNNETWTLNTTIHFGSAVPCITIRECTNVTVDLRGYTISAPMAFKITESTVIAIQKYVFVCLNSRANNLLSGYLSTSQTAVAMHEGSLTVQNITANNGFFGQGIGVDFMAGGNMEINNCTFVAYEVGIQMDDIALTVIVKNTTVCKNMPNSVKLFIYNFAV